LIVEIPEHCDFVANSVMMWNTVTNNYSLNGRKLTIPLEADSSVVRFCIIPVQGDNYAIDGFVEFTLDNDKTIKQPIGAVLFAATDLNIIVPTLTAQRTIPVRGVSSPKSTVNVFDNGELISQTFALANGNWSLKCTLTGEDEFSYHDLYAEIITPQGSSILTETKEVIYDPNAVEVSKVTMYNTAHTAASQALFEFATVFDFIDPPKEGGVYWYWPNYPDFTYKIEFTNNERISDVKLDVLLINGNTVTLPVRFNNAKQVWVATEKFDTYNLPVNVKVLYQAEKYPFYDISETQTEQNVKTSLGLIMTELNLMYRKFMMCPMRSAEEKLLVKAVFDTVREKYIQATKGDQGIVSMPLYGTLPKGKRLKLSAVIKTVYETKSYGLHPKAKAIDELIKWDKSLVDYIEDASCDPPPSSTFELLPATPVLDPSGYVYEAVPSNYLPGVTATVYQKVWVEDIYGNSTEETVPWDATDYGQKNPQITNEYGMYGWDVPQGLWQVKYEKDGYETVYSDWLPVPPPQLDINVAMKQSTPPSIKTVHGYENGIEIEFSKFMLPSTMTTDRISVTGNGNPVSGTIELLDAEINPANTDEQFVSRVRFVPETPFSISDVIVLTVKKEVKSYAETPMTEDFIQTVEIQKEAKSLVATPVLDIALNDNGFIEISVVPGEVAAGKVITAQSVSSAIVTVPNNVTLNGEGKARLQVTGELPGSTQIVVSLDGTNLEALVIVNVAMPVAIVEQVATPEASIPSGSTVELNTEITLSSDTPGSTILYTFDDASSANVSWLDIQPIVIVGDVIIQAKAIKAGMSDSEIVTFTYLVDDGTKINQPGKQTITVYTRNQTLFIKGLEPREQYTIYSVLGEVIAQGIANDNSAQSVLLPSKGVFIVSTKGGRVKVLVK
jgi:hypothetical protein